MIDLAKNARDVDLGMKLNSEPAAIQGKLIDVQQQTMDIQQENQQHSEIQ